MAGVLAGRSLNSNMSNVHVNLSGGVAAHVHYQGGDVRQDDGGDKIYYAYMFNASSFAGGMVGQSMDSNIWDSDAVITDRISALSERVNPVENLQNYDAAAGGLVGWSRGVVRNSYAVVGVGVLPVAAMR